MVRGFYMLASGILTRNRQMNAESNNIANTETTGYKAEKITSKTFGSMMMDRMDSQVTPIGSVTLMNTAGQNVTDFSEGTIQETGRNLDFAINGDGFFGVQTANGVQYTRSGSFSIDNQGYLVLDGAGRILGQNGPIYLGTDDITADGTGNLYAGGQYAGTISLYTFGGANAVSTGEGLYTGSAAPMNGGSLIWKSVEGSNVNTAQEMTDAISSQRGLQTCAQALQIYDRILDQATSEIGKV